MNFICRNIIIIFNLLIVINCITLSQDTTKPVTKPVTKEDTAYVQNFILADHNHQYLNKTDPDTLTRRRFLWYPAKTLEDIFNHIPGYYQYFMDVGQMNPLSYNQFSFSRTGILRNGRPINDLFNGVADLNLLSRNEISEMEFSNGYGNTIYDQSNTVNIVQRELFQFRPYTEISFYQDRYENLYFDGNFHQNFFRKLNFNFGITKHSYDGHYDNSEFDKWLGRFNLWFAPSAKMNLFLKVNYSKINRELNEGLNPDTVNLGSKEEVFNTSRAIVIYSKQHERIERFDVDLGTIFHAVNNSTSKLQFYVSNSFRELFRLSNLINPNSPERQDNYHWINYGIKLSHQFKFRLTDKLLFITNTEGDYIHSIYQIDQQNITPSIYYNKNEVRGIQEASIQYNNFKINGFIKAKTLSEYYNNYEVFGNISLTSGAKAEYRLMFNDSSSFMFTGTYDYSDEYLSASAKFKNKVINAGCEFYYYRANNYPFYFSLLSSPPNVVYRGINSFADIKIYKFRLSFNYNYNFRNTNNLINPEHSGRINLIFEDNAFKNKLEYKIGLTTRYWSDYKALFFDGFTNTFKSYVGYEFENNYNLRIPANATLDFYIIGKIGKATFGLTLENILDRIIYNTGVYPFMDRGGFLNSISRFNITWNFFD
ncbi:MAG: TonB-dependent receptor plug domain-containing protein [Ignavibacteria bacterium]